MPFYTMNLNYANNNITDLDGQFIIKANKKNLY